MQTILILLKRELAAYFQSPIAYVFISIFVVATAATSIFLGQLFASNDASMRILFLFTPWIFLFLVPAVGMRLWAEERSTGSIEFLLTLPITIKQAVIAKFIAGWLFIAFSLLLTFLYPLTIFFLGAPDIGAMLVGYLGSWLLAGGFLAISCFTSALTRNQVISFIFSFIICFFLTILGWGVFSDLLNQFLPIGLTDFIAEFGVLLQIDPFQKGVIDLKSLSYFIILILGSLALTVKLLEDKRN